MKTPQEILAIAKKTIDTEAEAIANLANLLNNDFSHVVQLIIESNGRVIITGIGKSANIAQKIVATLNSTGTPSVFMHAADAIHGDLGNVQKDDIVIAISKSGNTPEIKVLVPLVKSMGNKLVALTGNIDSYLSQQADYTLDSTVSKEACPNNLAPTSSTTAQLVIGDALSTCLQEVRGFTSKDFAKYHPGGALGKRLYLTVEDIIEHTDAPKVSPSTPLKDVIIEISSKRFGITAVLDGDKLVGVITDGDLRRMLGKTTDIDAVTAADIMGGNPKTIEKDTLAAEALQVMESNSITQLLVVEKGAYVGVIHLHDILKEGIL